MTSLAFLTRGAVGDSRSTRQEHHFGASSSRGPQRDPDTNSGARFWCCPTILWLANAVPPAHRTTRSADPT